VNISLAAFVEQWWMVKYHFINCIYSYIWSYLLWNICIRWAATVGWPIEHFISMYVENSKNII